MKPRTLGIVVAVLALLIIGFVFFRLPQPIIEIKPEKIFAIGGFTVTNTILTAWIMIAIIAVVTILGTRRMELIPRGFQNLFEAVVEGFANIATDIAGERNGRRFFPVVFTFFLYIVLCNWAALTPLFNQIGIVENLSAHIAEEAHEHPNEVVHEAEEIHGWVMKKGPGDLGLVPWPGKVHLIEVEVPAGTTFADRERMLAEKVHQKLGRELHNDEFVGFVAPFLRGVNTDVNAPLSYALWSAIFVEMWGITTLGFFRYGSKFFNVGRLIKGPGRAMGIIDVFVGLLELVSELARIISFTFRLFGNIFAGEVLLFMMSFLIPFLLVDVFYALELFVGLIQAFVFAMLTLVFGVLAVTSHGDHGAEHGHGGERAAHAAAHA